MALIKCKECKKEVAKTAKACPHCGVKNPGTTIRQQIIGIVAVIAIIAAAVSMCSPDADEVTAAGAAPTPSLEASPVEDADPEPEPVTKAEEPDPFGPESQAILDEFIPRMSALVESGLSMEPLRQSANPEDLGQCGDMMRHNQAELSSVRDDFSAALKSLPPEQSRWSPNFEPLHNATANLIRCVTCVPTALPDCQEAAQALGIQ